MAVEETTTPIMKLRPANIDQYIENYYNVYAAGLRKVIVVTASYVTPVLISKSLTGILPSKSVLAQLTGGNNKYINTGETLPTFVSKSVGSTEGDCGGSKYSGDGDSSFTVLPVGKSVGSVVT